MLTLLGTLVRDALGLLTSLRPRCGIASGVGQGVGRSLVFIVLFMFDVRVNNYTTLEMPVKIMVKMWL
jgi:hypothetical protein